MSSFKPMVKMETTEPSVILKLKKGGHVASKAKAKEENGHKPMHKADGGMMGALAGAPALVGRPVTASPVATPMKPSMAARRKAMMGKKPRTAPVPVSGLKPTEPAMPAMNKGGMACGGMAEGGDMDQDKAMIKKAIKQHDAQEHKGGKGTKLKLKKGGDCFATGGVVMGQGGYKDGGMAKGGKMPMKDGKPAFLAKKGGGGMHMMPNGKMMKNSDMSKMKKGGEACATGGVMNGNGGGYATGGVANGQGGYKKGGATKKFADGGAVQDDGRAVKMPQGSKKPSSPVSINRLSGTYKMGGKVGKYAKGGMTDAEMDRAMDKGYEESSKRSSDIEEALNPLSMMKDAFGKVKNYFTGTKPPAKSVTKTKESVTVAKKSGGKC